MVNSNQLLDELNLCCKLTRRTYHDHLASAALWTRGRSIIHLTNLAQNQWNHDHRKLLDKIAAAINQSCAQDQSSAQDSPPETRQPRLTQSPQCACLPTVSSESSAGTIRRHDKQSVLLYDVLLQTKSKDIIMHDQQSVQGGELLVWLATKLGGKLHHWRQENTRDA